MDGVFFTGPLMKKQCTNNDKTNKKILCFVSGARLLKIFGLLKVWTLFSAEVVVVL